jgi:hypothetical protein
MSARSPLVISITSRIEQRGNSVPKRRLFTIGSRSPEQDFVCALVFCLGVVVGGSIGQHFATSIVVVGALFGGALAMLAHVRRLRS